MTRPGRALPPNPFSRDDGAAAPALTAALAAHATGSASTAEVVAALASARLLVPVVAVVGEVRHLGGSLAPDHATEMALVTLTGPDGVRGLPAFSAAATLVAWDPAARPVPVESARAALSAVAEGCDRLLVDLAGPHPFVVRRPPLWAIAQGRAWLPAPADPDVAAAVERATAGVDAVAGARCEPGRTAELRVVLGIRAGLDRADLDAVLDRVRQSLAGEQIIAERVESVELRVLPA